MPKGNPYGNKGGPWLDTAKLRALFMAGLTFDEVAEANERSTGWKPDRAVVKRKYDAMGMPPRNARHTDLIPWKVKPEHNSSELRHMLQAESRKRQHKQLSDSDRRLVSLLHSMLFNRGKLMVVGYHPDVGFGLYPREDYDEDIVRQPRAARYASDDGIAEKALRRDAEARQEADHGTDTVAASSQRRASGS